jgi:hypothetical protein
MTPCACARISKPAYVGAALAASKIAAVFLMNRGDCIAGQPAPT